MGRSSLPPGFRFHPTDVELVQYYLKRKIMGKRLHYDAVAEVDMYKFAPWDLPEKVCLRSKDLEWYFFCPRDRKYGCGQRVNRSADIGYWKTTGKDRPVYYDSFIVGMRKTLVFHTGKAPHGERTDWVVHEYRLEDKRLTLAGVSQGSYVLCRLFKKSGLGPKNGEQYGAPFIEEEWEDDTVTDGSTSTFCNQPSAVDKDQPSGRSEGSLMVNVPVEVEDPIERFLYEVLCDEPDLSTSLRLPGTSNPEHAAGMDFSIYNNLDGPAANYKPSYLVDSSVPDPSSSSDWMSEMALFELDWEPVTYFPELDQIGESYVEINDLWSSLGDEADAEHDHAGLYPSR